MSSPLIPIVLAGAAVVLLSGKKSRRSSRAASAKTPQYKRLPQSIPQIYSDKTLPYEGPDTKEIWTQRQQALTLLSGVEIRLPDGSLISICSKCDPKGVDGKAGKNTRSAAKAFQALAGLDVGDDWGAAEDKAMQRILTSLQKGEYISCDPLLTYPNPFACFAHNDSFALMPVAGASGRFPEDEPAHPSQPSPASSDDEDEQWGPDDIVVADPECEFIIHQSDKWFEIQRRMMIEYALDGMTDSQAANEIHEKLLSDYLPLCLTLGRNGVGEGVRSFWDTNLGHIASELKSYEMLPEFLEEDAIRYGLLD